MNEVFRVKAMKMKQMILSTAVALVSSAAWAIPTYWAAAHTIAATVGGELMDTSAGANVSSYSGYYCTVETAQKLLGTTTADVYDMTDLVAGSFEASQAALKEGATALNTRYYEEGQYILKMAYSSPLTEVGYLALLFYENGEDRAVRVMASDSYMLAEEGSALFDDDMLDASVMSDGKNAPWTAAVPEPTSGLLVLFGIAGLALRRKRV